MIIYLKGAVAHPAAGAGAGRGDQAPVCRGPGLRAAQAGLAAGAGEAGHHGPPPLPLPRHRGV